MSEILQSVSEFIFSKDFWFYHGWVLTLLWVLLALAGIVIKRKILQLHLLSFAIVDYPTLFFGGAGLYRVWVNNTSFWEWTLIKQIHVVGGVLLLSLMIIQHVGGILAYYQQKPNKNHRDFGRILTTIGRVVAIFGWILTKEYLIAKVVGGITLIITIWHFVVEKRKVKTN